MKSAAPVRRHTAGPLVDCVQRCTRCGFILQDFREQHPGEHRWPEGQDVVESGPMRLTAKFYWRPVDVCAASASLSFSG